MCVCVFYWLSITFWCDSKESACRCRRHIRCGPISGSGRFPGEGNGNPFHYSWMENSMDRGASCAIVHGITESDTTKHKCIHIHNIFICVNFVSPFCVNQYFIPFYWRVVVQCTIWWISEMFQALLLWDKTAMNILKQVFLWKYIFVLLDK